MRVLLRADASADTGTGHVMRLLTLAEELRDRGHDVTLCGAMTVPWLEERLAQIGAARVSVPARSLDGVEAAEWDVVAVDSYDIPAAAITRLARDVPVLAVIDGDDRGIAATHYVDPNLGAEDRPRGEGLSGRISAGSRYALVRRSVRALRRDDRWRIAGRPRVLVVFGGSDPTGAGTALAPHLGPLLDRADVTLVSAGRATRSGLRIIPPGPGLPAALDTADLVITAAGTGAAEVAAIGVPAVFVAVVENQRHGVRELVRAQIGPGVDASADIGVVAQTVPLALQLLDDEEQRRSASTRGLAAFDGRGAARVAGLAERLARG